MCRGCTAEVIDASNDRITPPRIFPTDVKRCLKLTIMRPSGRNTWGRKLLLVFFTPHPRYAYSKRHLRDGMNVHPLSQSGLQIRGVSTYEPINSAQFQLDLCHFTSPGRPWKDLDAETGRLSTVNHADIRYCASMHRAVLL